MVIYLLRGGAFLRLLSIAVGPDVPRLPGHSDEPMNAIVHAVSHCSRSFFLFECILTEGIASHFFV